MTATVTIEESIVIDPQTKAPYLLVIVSDDEGNVISEELR